MIKWQGSCLGLIYNIGHKITCLGQQDNIAKWEGRFWLKLVFWVTQCFQVEVICWGHQI